jgi:hypothetical protein
MESRVSRFTNLPDLQQWLVNDRKAHREPQSEASYSLGTQPSRSALSPQDDEFDDLNSFVSAPTELLGAQAPRSIKTPTDCYHSAARASNDGKFEGLLSVLQPIEGLLGTLL